MFRLFTHNDLDGVGCGIIAKIAFNEEVEIRYNSVSSLDYQITRYFEKTNEKQKKEDFLFITDLSINEDNSKTVDQFVKDGNKAMLIDHHKTSLRFNDYTWGFVRVEYEDGRLTCATSLFYEYLIQHQYLQPSKVIEEFIELVRLYDTWEWEKQKNIKAKQLNDLLYMTSIEEFEEKMVLRLQQSDTFEFNEFEEKLLQMEEDKLGRYIRRKKREVVQTFIGEYCTGIVHAESYHSELGNELGKEYAYLDYIAILNMGGKKISFRTIHDHVDVSAVAMQFGGGGHAKAAGCSINEEAYELYVHKVFPLTPIKMEPEKNQHNLKNNPSGSLYETKNGENLVIYEKEKGKWFVKQNKNPLPEEYANFEEAEKFIKRSYSAWLSRDDKYIEYFNIKNKNLKKE